MSFLTSRSHAARQGFGKPVPRKEDARLVSGRGRYSDDFNLPGQAQAQLVRSPHAHARVLGIDVTAALAVPGVIAVLTGTDAEADGLKPIPQPSGARTAPSISLRWLRPRSGARRPKASAVRSRPRATRR